MKDFNGKVAVVTGAASGIGNGLVEKCLAEGMRVVMADVETDALEASATALQASGDHDILPVTCDVSNRDEVHSLADKTVEHFGGVHLLFNNAGIAAGGSVWDSTYHDWEWVMGVNLWGVIHGVKAFMPRMMAQDTECHIVNTASVAGLLPGYGSASYAVTKHGVVALTENLYAWLGGDSGKIGASVLCPGYVSTRIYDCERNRPAVFSNPDRNRTREEGIQQAAGKAMLETGMKPSVLADIVFDGIRAKQLYIQTHDLYNHFISDRADSIVSGTNPNLGRSDKDIAELMSRRVERTKEQLEVYTGNYRRGGYRLTYELRGDELWFTDHVAQRSHEVIPVGEHRFETTASYDGHEFVLEGDATTKCLLSVAGATFDFRRDL